MLGRVKVSAVEWGDGDALHRKITKAGYATQANRVVAYGSKMFALAIKWRMRADNPFKGIERNGEQRRKRYASAAELKRLMDALDALADPDADIFYLCLLTGCRVGEAMAARWDGIGCPQASGTGPQAQPNRRPITVPLSAHREAIRGAARRR
jgi:integrase